jgi:transcriptional regulator with XRE-family HTH domain
MDRQTIRQIRQDKGLGLRSFADRLGVTGATVSKIERGMQVPRSELAAQICRELGVPDGTFLYPQPPVRPYSVAQVAALGPGRPMRDGAPLALDEVIETLVRVYPPLSQRQRERIAAFLQLATPAA